MLHRLELIEDALAEIDEVIAEACRPWAHQLELLQTIPGVGPKVAQVILAETGGDMSRFPSAAHLASWAGLAPGILAEFRAVQDRQSRRSRQRRQPSPKGTRPPAPRRKPRLAPRPSSPRRRRPTTPSSRRRSAMTSSCSRPRSSLLTLNGAADPEAAWAAEINAENEQAPAAAAANAAAGRAVPPTTGRVTSCYGSRWGSMHYGVDIAAPIGTPIYTPQAGVCGRPDRPAAPGSPSTSSTPTGRTPSTATSTPTSCGQAAGRRRAADRRGRQQWSVHRPAPALRCAHRQPLPEPDRSGGVAGGPGRLAGRSLLTRRSCSRSAPEPNGRRRPRRRPSRRHAARMALNGGHRSPCRTWSAAARRRPATVPQRHGGQGHRRQGHQQYRDGPGRCP